MIKPVIRYFDEINEGMSGEISKVVTEKDISAYADLTGDKNLLHIDADYAKGTIFGQRVTHGMLVAGFISAVFGSNFPGPGWIYVNQTLQFRAPVFIAEEVKVNVRVKKLITEKEMVEFGTVASVADRIAITGIATLKAPVKLNQ